MEFNRRHCIVAVGACAVAAGFWYLNRRRCSCDQCNCEYSFQSTVHIIENDLEWQSCSMDIISSIRQANVIAIDCEWTQDESGRRKVALLQIGLSSETLALIRLCKLSRIPDELAKILKNPDIIKVGVGVLDDAKKLQDDYKVQVNGCLDIRYMALATPSVRKKLIENKANLSLASMVSVILDIDLAKEPEVRCSNWEVDELSDEQIAYASCDVFYAYVLAAEIARSNSYIIQVISRLFSSKFWLDHFILYEFNEYIGIQYRRAPPRRRQTTPPKPSTDKALKSYSARKKPLYDNCILLCPDGELLCTCDQRKAIWYVDNNLGEVVKESPLTIRLSFEPSQRAILDGQYYSIRKENKCVVCGNENDLVRKNVVPREYRKHFPKIMKHHCAHDVVLTCISCHHKSCIEDEFLKAQLAEKCEAFINSSIGKFVENQNLKAIRSAAKALRKRRQNIPEERRIELETSLKKYFDVEQLTDELIDDAAEIDSREVNEEYISHGQKVVETHAKNGGLLKFESMWRQYFLDRMKPRHLPKMWSTDHHHDVLAIKLSFIKEANADEAQRLMAMLGFTEEQISEILSRLEETERLKVEKMSFNKGRLMDNSQD